uniref:LOW QUALITY PROTEIN: GTPase-activating protein and VPS9 domain-containing protein 1-like n=1 Tax=Myxine glutinosa TaxID=7769 RepID=UPI00358F9C0F
MKADITVLARHLKEERLYVTVERQMLQRLNAEVLKTAERLYHTAWISKEQRLNLDRLILTSADASPAECCQRAKVLQVTHFVDGYRRLGVHEGACGDFLSRLRDAPRLVVACLVCGERAGLETTPIVAQTVYTVLYASAITPHDEAYLLQVLRYLAEFSLKPSDSPRRLLRRGNCSFSLLYRLLSEGLAAAKLFLTAALREPILRLLVEDLDRLETDPVKLLDSLDIRTEEKLFGPRSEEPFAARLAEAVEANVVRLVALVHRFAGSLRRSVHCFPLALRWVISQVYEILACIEGVGPGEARAVCTDLLLPCFICPALVNPEQYGVIADAPINEVARFNLMQVGQVLQQLAMVGIEEGDPRMRNIVNRFDRGCVAGFVDSVIGGRVLDGSSITSFGTLDGLHRSSMLSTLSQLHNLVNFLRTVHARGSLREGCLKEEDVLTLESLLTSFPSLPEPSPTAARSPDASCLSSQPSSATTTLSSRKNLLQIAQSASRGRSRLSPVLSSTWDSGSDADLPDSEAPSEMLPDEVLVISLTGGGMASLPGLLSETEVLAMEGESAGRTDTGDVGKSESKPDKTLRFSLCSDNLEAVSEGPSNRSNSVSSLDLEAESASEMTSAGAAGGSDGAAVLHLLEHEQATTQDNLDDKLRKFEIRDMMGLSEDQDILETVSETWSTDVVGSDFDPNLDEDRLQEIAGTSAESLLTGLLTLPDTLEASGATAMSETTSEAWSVEVLASDSEATELKQEERLQELESCSGLGSVSDDTDMREVGSRPSTPGLSVVSGISEDNPNKPEDMRSECGSDFGGKDCMTSPETDEVARGLQQVPSPAETLDGLLSIFDPLSITDVPHPVRPIIQVSRADQPSNDSPCLHELADASSSHQFSTQLPIPPPPPSPSGPFSDCLGAIIITGSAGECSETEPVTSPRPFGWKFERPHSVRERFSQLVRPRSSEHSGVVAPRSALLGHGERRKFGNMEEGATGVATAVWSKRGEEGLGTGVMKKIHGAAAFSDELSAGQSWSSRRQVQDEEYKVNGPNPDGTLGLSGNIIPSPLPSPQDVDLNGTLAIDQPGEDRKDDDDKSERGMPWWKKKLSAIQKAPMSFKRKDKHERERYEGLESRFVAIPDEAMQALPVVEPQTFVAEDILDKYRSAIKRSSPEEHSTEHTSEGDHLQESPRADSACSVPTDDLADSASQSALPRNSAFTFRDAKKKLRLALCSADAVAYPIMISHHGQNGPLNPADPAESEDDEVICFLKVQLAEAIHLQDKACIAQFQEALRCVTSLDSRTCRKLLSAIEDDYRHRTPYLAYLTRSRQALQSTQAHLERVLQWVGRDTEIVMRYFTVVCVRLFLQQREDPILGFIHEFQGLTASDDKTALVEDFLGALYGEMAQDSIWTHASEEQLQHAQTAIERSIMSRVFKLAFHPNLDGDILRDQLFSEHIQRLAKVVGANHPTLQIPDVYLKEAPWPSAQAEIRTISAYKTPRDKVQCVLRTCSTIMNLLSLASEGNVPGADDFVPVLVYILIKANPPCLLSTVQYINAFYEKRLSGEELYWWMQFTAALEFMKTIDERK